MMVTGAMTPDTVHHAENRQQHHIADHRPKSGDAVILGEAHRDATAKIAAGCRTPRRRRPS